MALGVTAITQPLTAPPPAGLQVSRQPASASSYPSFSETLAGVHADSDTPSSAAAPTNAPIANPSVTPGPSLRVTTAPAASLEPDSGGDLPASTSTLSQLAATIDSASGSSLGLIPGAGTPDARALLSPAAAPPLTASTLTPDRLVSGAIPQATAIANFPPGVRSASLVLASGSAGAKAASLLMSMTDRSQPQPTFDQSKLSTNSSDTDSTTQSAGLLTEAATTSALPAAGSGLSPVPVEAAPSLLTQLPSRPGDSAASQQFSTPVTPLDTASGQTPSDGLQPLPDPRAALSIAVKSTFSAAQDVTPAGRGDTAKRHKKAIEAAGQASVEQTDTVSSTLLTAPTLVQSSEDPTNQNAQPDGMTATSSLLSGSASLVSANCSPASLAFAVKLTGSGPAAQIPGNALSAASQPVDPLNNATLGKSEEPFTPSAITPTTGSVLVGSLAANQFAAQTQASSSQPQPASGPGSAPSPSANAAVADASAASSTSASPAAPVRAMQVQIAGQDNQRVDLRLIERSGSLSLSVRTMDGNLTRALQEHLPDLTTKLAAQPTQTEWWTPETKMTSSSSSSGNGSSTKDDSPGSQSQGNPGGQDQGRQQGGRQQNQPGWVDELAAIGNKNNLRREYIWHP